VQNAPFGGDIGHMTQVR